MSGYLTTSGSSRGATGSRALGPWEVHGSDVVDVDEGLDLALTTGDNTVAVPNSSVAVVIVPAAGSPALSVRTNLNASDAGLPLAVVAANNEPVALVYPLATGVTSLILHSAGSGQCDVEFV